MRQRRTGRTRKTVRRVRRKPVRQAARDDDIEAISAGGGDDKGEG